MLARAFAKVGGLEVGRRDESRVSRDDPTKRTSRFATCPICEAAVYIHYLDTHVNQHLDTLDRLRTHRRTSEGPVAREQPARHYASSVEGDRDGDVEEVVLNEEAEGDADELATEGRAHGVGADEGRVGLGAQNAEREGRPAGSGEPDAPRERPVGEERHQDGEDLPESTSGGQVHESGVYGNGDGENFPLQVMSGDHLECGICKESWGLGRERFVLWPCQHTRQCGTCALRVWKQPKDKRRCPWCKARIEIRPRAFRPFM